MIIYHIIVSYNSPDDLNVLLNQIYLQDSDSQNIIIVDNSDIRFRIKNKEVVSSFSVKFNLIHLFTVNNVGSAKGFALGMYKAFQLNADWVWLHDQDGYPNENCLATIKPYLSDFSILTPKVNDESNNYLNVFNGKIDEYGNFFDISLNDEIPLTDLAATAGLMVSKELYNCIGPYDFRKYFVGMEDFDYSLRARKAGFSLGIVKDASYFHPNKWPNASRNVVNKYKFLGVYDQGKIKCGEIFFYSMYVNKNFYFSLLYSVLKLSYYFFKSLDFSYIKSFKFYLIGLYFRLFKTNWVSISTSDFESSISDR